MVLKLYRTHVDANEADDSLKTGAMVRIGRNRFGVVAGEGTLLVIDELQLAGKKRMKVEDFMNGMKDIENYFVR
jgi:methionyl-tRNA formyltransferase